MDLSEFLLARFVDDEAEARFWACDCTIEGLPLRHGLRCEERVKSECDAKRRIVERGAGMPWVVNDDLAPGYANFGPDRNEADAATVARMRAYPPPEVLRLLALPYAAHPDYREEWKV